MADYTVTAANVRASAGANTNERTCGEAGGLAAGDAVYLDDNDKDANGIGKAKKASSATAGLDDVDGICLNAASLGQPVVVCDSDPSFTPGCTVAVDDIGILSTNAGKTAPYSDLASGHYLTILWVGITTTTVNLAVNRVALAKA